MSRYFVIISDDKICQSIRLSSAQRNDAIDLIKHNLIVLNRFTELAISLDTLSGVPSIEEFTPQTNLASERARGAVGVVSKIAAEFRATQEETCSITGATSISDRSKTYAA